MNWITKIDRIAIIAVVKSCFTSAAIRSGWAIVSSMLVLVVVLSTHSGVMQSGEATEEPTPLLPADGSHLPTEWELLAPGLERQIFLPDDVYWSLSLMVLRIDPEYYRFEVHYNPGERVSTGLWWWRLPRVQAFINANFFDSTDEVVGLLVASGEVYGTPFDGFGGTFLVLNDQPYVLVNTAPLPDPENTPYQQLVQGSPMLVVDGEVVYAKKDEEFARRTLIAQDSQGRVLMIVTAYGGARLQDLSAYLVESDLNIVNAFNLDGGTSTMMYVAAQETTPPYMVASQEAVPAVLAIYNQPPH